MSGEGEESERRRRMRDKEAEAGGQEGEGGKGKVRERWFVNKEWCKEISFPILVKAAIITFDRVNFITQRMLLMCNTVRQGQITVAIRKVLHLLSSYIIRAERHLRFCAYFLCATTS